MSLVSQVAAAAGVSAAEVARVATHGGTSAADWDIAHAIEKATGRSAVDLMWGPAHIPHSHPQDVAERTRAAQSAAEQRAAQRAAQTPQDEAEVDDDVAELYSDLVAVVGARRVRRVFTHQIGLGALRAHLWGRGISRAQLRRRAAHRRGGETRAPDSPPRLGLAA